MPGRRRLLFGLLALSLGGAGWAQDPEPGSDPADDPQPIIAGEITDLSERSFQIRPWALRFPRRLTVIAAPETTYVRMTRGSRKSLKTGELLLALYERDRGKVPVVPRREGDEPALPSGRPARPVETFAVLRLGGPVEEEPSRIDRRRAACYLDAVRPWFLGERRGGLPHPGRRTDQAIGVATSLDPLTLRGRRADRLFRFSGRTLIVDPQPIRPQDLKAGRSVTMLCAGKPGADGTVLALVVAVSPRPRVSEEQMRKIRQRERGPGDR